MSTTRRDFVKTVAAAAGALSVTGLPSELAARQPIEPAGKPLRILVLGGTGFTGPRQVEYALARGHHVTTFNRGRTRPGLFSGRVEELIGDRNSDLKALEGKQWDVVIDVPTSLPVWVRDVAQVLQGNVGHYVFISTVSVYDSLAQAGTDVDAPTAQYEGADVYAETQQTLRANMGLYGPLKAASEREVEKWFPGKNTIIRPGLIVGPDDPTDRFTYWPVRVDRGGEILAPGHPTDPVQIIDARDLAEWVIRMAESQVGGRYNALGPVSPLSIAEMLHGIRAVVSGNRELSFTWVPADFLEQHEVRPWSHMPVWIPPVDDYAGFARVSNHRAVEQGLTFRPLADTVRDTLEWWATLPEDRRAQLRAGLPAEREREVLAAFRASGGAASQ